jgi:hypothetical protein
MNNIQTKTWSKKEHLFYGIWVYRDVIKEEFDIPNRLENLISNSHLSWSEAQVGYKEKNLNYRDCFDFKIRKIDSPHKNEEVLISDKIWQDVYDLINPAVQDYSRMYSIQLNFWEAMNFVKYGPGQHFQEHSDHGHSYTCVLSAVAYPNDDYEGGELSFGKLGVSFKPKAGDLYLFPSTYLFSHRAMPVISGTKYSIVTMLDYNEDAHTPEYRNGRYAGETAL